MTMKKKTAHSHQLHHPNVPGASASPSLRQALFQSAPRSPYRASRVKPHQRNGESEDESKRRELAWNTSFPFEYHHSHMNKDYQQTLAYQEQVNQRRQQETALATGFDALELSSPLKSSAPAAPRATKEELEVLKHVTLREGLVTKLQDVAQTLSDQEPGAAPPESVGTELLHLLLQLRDASVTVVIAMAQWHGALLARTGSAMVTLPSFVYEQHSNYCVKMVSDLNFLASIRSLSHVLGVDPSKMRQNPFMMPAPISDRDFHALTTAKTAKPPRFAFTDPVERVAEAEKYLVWCLVHTAPPPPPPQPAPSTSPPRTASKQQSSSPLQRDPEALLTWQQRAEQQLRLLSMPMESASGHLHVMDSSRMMKRKGYLPSLPTSPPKTLTQLMDTVSTSSPVKATGAGLHVVHVDGLNGDVIYRTTPLDLEVLGSSDAPPHHIVTLVSASVLILLSPSDRIPKNLAWPSCQKMLRDGRKLIQKMDALDVRAVPSFKWKALLPFIQNEHFQPVFLSEYSRAAATLCAWVLDVLARAQQLDHATTKADEDRSELLAELEREDLEHTEPAPRSALRPLSRGSSGKRVSIGNAEVLFINENQTMTTSSPRPLSSSSTPSRPGTSSSARLTRSTSSHILLRTSPWTHRGVTYFVSFFLEKSTDEGIEPSLSIKLYEPMSSVESQMFVTADDLSVDFGEHAREYFRRRQYDVLCDLILGQLDRMMMQTTSSSSTASFTRLPTGEGDEKAAAAVRIQSIARQRTAKKEAAHRRAERYMEAEQERHEAALRVQCAVRQQHARKKVKHVRFAKQRELETHQERSAVKIQSIARQRHARKRVAHMKLLKRTPTGLGDRHDIDDDEEATYDEPDEHEKRDERKATPRRPTTAASESEQFEDDFEPEE